MEKKKNNQKTTETSLLSQVGLSKNEAQIYEIMLKLGKIPASKIFTNLSQKRTTVYAVLEELIKKGLVEKDDSQPVAEFRAKHPYTLKEMIDTQVQSIKTAENKLDAVLPDFISFYNQSQKRPGIVFYEGIAGIKKIHQNILTEQKEILAYVYINKEVDKILANYWESYYKTRIKNNIHVRAVSPNNSDGKQYKKNDEKELRETRLIPEDQFPITIEKNICGNKVAYLSLQPNELLGVMIESAEIAKTEKSIFELVWKQAKNYI